MVNLPPLLKRRFAHQINFKPIGLEGQKKLCDSFVLVCGCGGLGTAVAELLVRAGVGVQIVDNDEIELNNLHRQALYLEEDQGVPKYLAANYRLRQIFSQGNIETTNARITADNIGEFICNAYAVADCTDNFETRFIINDAAAEYKVPWVYGGCSGSKGVVLPVLPDKIPCLRCLFPEGRIPSNDEDGVIGPVVRMTASLQVAEILKILTDNIDAVNDHMTIFDLWTGVFSTIKFDGMRVNCPIHGQRENKTDV